MFERGLLGTFSFYCYLLAFLSSSEQNFLISLCPPSFVVIIISIEYRILVLGSENKSEKSSKKARKACIKKITINQNEKH